MERHRNILYAFVFILLILQVSSFIVMSSQVTSVQTNIDLAKENFRGAIEAQQKISEQNFEGVSDALSQQQIEFNQEIRLLKSADGDFSEVIKEAINGAVIIQARDSIGSGFIVDMRGFVITNNHVVSSTPNNIQVTTYSGTNYPAVLVGVDTTRDLVLLKINEGEYGLLEFADSNAVELGDEIVAIGTPFGFSFSTSKGILSGIHRTAPNGLAEYLQLDAALNPGNSGGPLIDREGKVVGVNNFKIGGSEGLGFAIESNSVKQFADDAIIYYYDNLEE